VCVCARQRSRDAALASACARRREAPARSALARGRATRAGSARRVGELAEYEETCQLSTTADAPAAPLACATRTPCSPPQHCALLRVLCCERVACAAPHRARRCRAPLLRAAPSPSGAPRALSALVTTCGARQRLPRPQLCTGAAHADSRSLSQRSDASLAYAALLQALRFKRCQPDARALQVRQIAVACLAHPLRKRPSALVD
jgi:hypothetical protein